MEESLQRNRESNKRKEEKDKENEKIKDRKEVKNKIDRTGRNGETKKSKNVR